MKIYLIAFLIGFSSSINLYAQEMKITANGKHPLGGASLSLIQGEKLVFVDSVYPSSNGDYTYLFLKEKHTKGFYRLQFDQRRFVNIVYDAEPVKAVINPDKIPDEIDITESESNKYYYRFIRFNKQFKTKTDILNYVLIKYPAKDDYYKTTLSETDKLQREYLELIAEIESTFPKTLIASYVKSAQLPMVDYTLPIDQQLNYLKTHLLDNVDFQDYHLTYTDVYANKAIEYLMLYSNPQLPKELLEREFMAAVDSILNRARKSESVYKHVVEYLIDGFRKFGFDLIIDYIVTNYVIEDDICLDAELETSIERRINQSKYLKIGNKVPELTLPDRSGNVVRLSEIKTEKTLLVFYSTGCPHCKDVLPQLGELYKSLKNTEIIAVSMDENKENWLKFIDENKFSWKDLHEAKGWGGKSVEDYFIYATPTMFILDRDKKIIAKPVNPDEVKRIVE